MQLVFEVQLTLAALALPNLKTVAVPSAKPVPVTVTLVPPDTEPEAGLSLVTVGVNAKWSSRPVALVPFGVVTVMSTTPADSDGETAVIEVAEVTVKLLALTEPNLTAVAAVRLVPVMVTVVPPFTGPLAGDTAVTLGASADARATR